MSFKISYIFVLLSVIWLHVPLGAQENLRIKGFGFFKNINYDRRLAFLHGVPANEPVCLNAAFLEDSAYLLLQQLKRNGYLKPGVEGIFQVGNVFTRAVWENAYSIQLDADFSADYATFYLRPGVFYYYESVDVSGVTALDAETIRRHFIPDGFWMVTKSSRVFTEGNFEQRTNRLLNTLRQMGYRKAKVVTKDTAFNHDTGAVAATLSIDPGPLHHIGQVVVEQIDSTGAVVEMETESPDGTLFTAQWEQSKQQALRHSAYREGYADVEISRSVSERSLDEQGVLILDIHYQIKLNSLVEFDGAQFSGDRATSPAVLERYMEMSVGDPLNPLLASRSRRQLMGLGIFKEVQMSYAPEDGPRRKVVYDLTPAPRRELDLLVGWGSYELLRAGFNWTQKNPFGRAHRYEINGKQSFRATNLRTTYSVPRFFESVFTAYASAEYSFREEVSFDRSEKSVTTGLLGMLADSDIMLTTEYRYSRNNADRDPSSDFDSNDNARIGSVLGRLSLDRRDNFLAPTTGYSLYSEINVANELLGGAVAFQKVKIGASFHTAFNNFILLHLGFSSGAIFSGSDDIPFTERFFNGGENTVRGYLEGEASPLDSNGEQIGAESFALLNAELEKLLLQNVSLVFFLDTVINARDGFFESGVDSLSSAGIGLRYRTVVGPVRLEYGHNLNPRPTDPDGTLHFSIGFPF